MTKEETNETIICINNKPFPVNEIGPDLILQKEYPLQAKFKCACGEEHYDVGLVNDVNYVECYKCREKLPSDIRWCHSSRFKAKIQQPYTTQSQLLLYLILVSF